MYRHLSALPADQGQSVRHPTTAYMLDGPAHRAEAKSDAEQAIETLRGVVKLPDANRRSR